MSEAGRSLRCPQCHYDLAGTPARQGRLVCPECGTPFSWTTADLRLSFPAVLAIGIGVPIMGAAMMWWADSSNFLVIKIPIAMVALASPLLFAFAASRRWRDPWRTPVFVRYFIGSAVIFAMTCVVMGFIVFLAR